jgi:hypothetical protein
MRGVERDEPGVFILLACVLIRSTPLKDGVVRYKVD